MESITDTATGVTFNDKGELVIPVIEDVPAADIKYCFRGVDAETLSTAPLVSSAASSYLLRQPCATFSKERRE